MARKTGCCLLAGLLLHRESPTSALERACRLGEFVASRVGATPIHEIKR